MASAVNLDDEVVGLVEGEGACVSTLGDGDAVLARGDIARPDRSCILLRDLDTNGTISDGKVSVIVWRRFAGMIEHVDIDAIDLQ